MEILFKWAEEEPYKIDSDVKVDLSRLIESGVAFTTGVHMQATLTRTKDHYEIDGSVTAGITVPCSRCLEDYPISITREVHLVLYPRPQYDAFVELHLGEDEMDVSFYTEEKVELEDIVSEQINLALPMRPLCRDECLGLCATCGADRNMGSCACA